MLTEFVGKMSCMMKYFILLSAYTCRYWFLLHVCNRFSSHCKWAYCWMTHIWDYDYRWIRNEPHFVCVCSYVELTERYIEQWMQRRRVNEVIVDAFVTFIHWIWQKILKLPSTYGLECFASWYKGDSPLSQIDARLFPHHRPVSYTHLTLPTIYSV